MESADIMEMVSRSLGKFLRTPGYCNVISSSSVLQQSISVFMILRLVIDEVTGKEFSPRFVPGEDDELKIEELNFKRIERDTLHE